MLDFLVLDIHFKLIGKVKISCTLELTATEGNGNEAHSMGGSI